MSTAAPELTSPPAGLRVVRPPRQSTSSWPLIDRAGYLLCWATGIALCLIALGIVLYMFVKGISYLRPSLLRESPAPSLQQSQGRRVPRSDRGHVHPHGGRHRDRRVRSAWRWRRG